MNMALCDINDPEDSCECDSDLESDETDGDLICTSISATEHRCMPGHPYEAASVSMATAETVQWITFKWPTPFVPITYKIPALITNHPQIIESLPSRKPTQEESISKLITNHPPFPKTPPSIKPPEINHPQNAGDVDFQNTNPPLSKFPLTDLPGKSGTALQQKPPPPVPKHPRKEGVNSPFTKPTEANERNKPPNYDKTWKSMKEKLRW